MLGNETELRLRDDIVYLSLALLMAFFFVRPHGVEWSFPMFYPRVCLHALCAADTAFAMHILAFTMRIPQHFRGVDTSLLFVGV
jgi:hypothetical protein